MSKCSATLAAASSKLMPEKIRSAPSASDISVALISCQPCSRGPAIWPRARIIRPTFQGVLKKHVQKSRWASRTARESGPNATACGTAAAVKPTRSGGTAIHTSCPRRTSSRPTASEGSTSPRLPQVASTNFIADVGLSLSCILRPDPADGPGLSSGLTGFRLPGTRRDTGSA